MPKGLGLAAAAGLTSGLVTLSVISGGGLGMLLAYVAPLPPALVGLAFGFGPCLVSLAVGALVLAVTGWTALPPFLVIGAIPALLVTAVALKGRRTEDGKVEWSKPGPMLFLLALGAVAMMALAVLSLLSEGTGIEGWLREQAAPIVEQALPAAPDEVKSAIVGLWAAVLPAMVGLAWLAMTLVNGLFAQWVVTRAGWALRPTPDYADLRLPLWLAPAAGLVAVSGLIGGDIGYLARNAAILLMAPYLVTGLVDVHASLRSKPMAALWLAVFYGVFLALFGWAAIAVTAWGVVRQWMRPRRTDPALSQERENGSHSA
jgi:hypothetical protein